MIEPGKFSIVSSRKPRLAAALILLSPLLTAQLTITAPANNTTYAPGSTVTVNVSVTTGSGITQVTVGGPDPIPWAGVLTAAPYTFQITLPSNTPIGAYNLFAIGNSGPGQGIQAASSPVTIFVDKNTAPAALTFEPANMTMSYLGAAAQMFVRGQFADGTNPTLNGSPQLTFTSSTPAVATVDGSGNVTAVAAGSTTIQATYQQVTVTATVTVTAGAAPVSCSFSVQAGQSSFTAGGGNGSVTVTASNPGCSWYAAPGASWITLTPPNYAVGSGTAAYSVSTNASGNSRTSTLLIAGKIISITQASSTCSYTVSTPATPAYGAAGTGSVTVTTGSTCGWVAASDSSWLTISSGASGTGNGTVSYSIASNTTSGARTANLTVAGQPFPITQNSSNCTYAGGFPTTTPPATGGTGTATVTAPTGCSWTVTSDSSWFTITSGVSGTGNGSFNFTVAQNTGIVSRSANVTVGTQTTAIIQSGVTCTFILGGTSASATAAGGTGSVPVNASSSACPWTAVSNAAWLTVTSGASSMGTGSVGFSVAADPDVAGRSGTITIAGQTFTVNQTGVVGAVTLNPTAVTVPLAGGTGSITVTANAPDFAWTATSNATWLTITAGASGTGNGTVSWSASANTGSTQSAIITVAGQKTTFTQISSTTSFLAFETNLIDNNGNVFMGVADTGSGKVIGYVPTPGGFTHAVTMKPDGSEAWAANNFGNTIVVTNASAATVATIPVTGNPRGVAFLPDGSRAYVVNEQGVITIIDTASYTVINTVNLEQTALYKSLGYTTGPFFMNIAMSLDGTRAFLCDVGGFFTVYDIASNTVTARVPTFLPPATYSTAQWVTLSPDGTLAFITDSSQTQGVLTIDTGLNQIIGTVHLGNAPRGIAVTPDGQKLYVANDTGNYVSVVSVANQQLLKTIPVNGTRGVAMSGDGVHVWATASGSMVEIDTTTDTIVKTITFPNYCCDVQISVQQPPIANRLANEFQTVDGGGGSGTVTVGTAVPTFSWTATTTASWITINSPASGTGPGSVSYTAQPNYGEAPREGYINIGGLIAIVVQQPAPYIITTLAGAAVPSSIAANALTSRIVSLAVSGGTVYAGATPGTVYRLTGGSAVPYAGTGVENSTGDGGPAVNAEIGQPWGMAFDSSGNLFFIDSTDYSVRRVDAVTKNISTVAGGNNWGSSGDGGPATLAQFTNMRGIAIDSAGNIYVGDTYNYKVRKITAATGVISTVAGAGYSGSGGTGTATSVSFGVLDGIAVDGAGNLYLSDSSNLKIWKVNSAGMMSLFAGTGVWNSSPDGSVASTSSITVAEAIVADSAGDIYFTDGNNKIRKVTAATGLLSTVAGSGNYGDAGDGGLALSASLRYPQSLAVDSAGNIYIGDGNTSRIRMVTAATGMISTLAGGAALPEGIPATSAFVTDATATATDSAGNTYYIDMYQHRLRRVDVKGNVTTVAGDGTAGYSGDGGLASSAELSYPSGVALDAAGNLYVADSGNAAVRRINASTGVIGTVVGGNGAGFAGDGGPASKAQLNSWLMSVAFDGNGNLFIGDSGNYRIRKVSGANSTISTVAGYGAPGYSGDTGPATAARFNAVYEMAVDAVGKIFVCDQNNYRVRKVTASTGIVTTIAGGTWGDTGDNGLATIASFKSPVSCAVDDAGNVFVADNQTHRIRWISAATGDIRPLAGTGTPGFSGDGGPATNAMIDSPEGLSVDHVGNLYSTDTGGGRVRKLTPPNLPCAITLSQSKLSVGASGGASSVNLTTNTGCAWTAVSNSSWLTITSAASGTGSGTVSLTAAGSTATRYGSLSVGGLRVDMVQGVVQVTAPDGLPAASLNMAYPATTMTAAGGVGNYTWSATGLPAGLTMGSATGAITGTPTSSTGSPFTVQITATDSNGISGTRTYTITVTGNRCDVNSDGVANVADVQRMINEALGIATAADDLNSDGTVNVADVQIVINAALGLGCAAH